MSSVSNSLNQLEPRSEGIRPGTRLLRPGGIRVLGRAWQVGQFGLLGLLLWAGWVLTLTTVEVSIDGVSDQVSTHRPTLRLLLTDLGIALDPADRVTPDLDTRLRTGMTVKVERAPSARIFVMGFPCGDQRSNLLALQRSNVDSACTDGREVRVSSWAETPAELLADANLTVDRYDQILVNGEQVALHDRLDLQDLEITETTPLQVRVYRAVPITVNDGNLPFTVRTTAQTVGEALRDAEITLYLGDRVQPSLGSPVSTGLQVTIQRSTPVTLHLAGQTTKTRTPGTPWSQTVGDALTHMGIGVSGLDRVTPSLDTELYDNIEIRLVRISEEIEIEEDIVPFETIFRPDRELLIDTQEVVNPGAEGITRRRYRVRYENGEEVERQLEDEWVAQQPAQRVIAYGQNVVPRTATVNGRQLTYWRRVRMKASSYSAATAGVSPDQAWYGRTRTGDRMQFGVVAVDPAVIPLQSRVYVPGYGEGSALDTGSAIQAKRIDLGYDNDNLVLWNRWVDVYLLWPPPPDYQITWVLPNWPVE